MIWKEVLHIKNQRCGNHGYILLKLIAIIKFRDTQQFYFSAVYDGMLYFA